MPNHAHFGSLVVIKESILNDVLRIYHSNDFIPTSFNQVLEVFVPLINRTVRLNFNLFMDSPKLSLAASENNKIGVKATFVGYVKFEVSPPTPLFPTVEKCLALDMTFQALPEILVLNPENIQIGLDFGDIDIQDITIRVCDGTSLSSYQGTALNSPDVLNAFQVFLRLIDKESLIITSEVLTDVRDDYNIILENDEIVLKVLDEALAIGASLLDGQGNYISTRPGDSDLIQDFNQGFDIAVATHPKVIFAALNSPDVQAQINAEQSSGIRITEFNVELEASNIKIFGKAKQSVPILPDPVANFSLRLRPVINGDQIEIDVYDIDISVSNWLKIVGFILGILSLGSAAFLTNFVFLVLGVAYAVIIPYVKDLIESRIEERARGERTHSFELPELEKPEVMVRIEHIEIGSNGIELRNTFLPNQSGIYLVGGRTIKAGYGGPVKYYLTSRIWQQTSGSKPTNGLYHPDDPSVRVRWQLAREGTNELIVQDKSIVDNAPFQFIFNHALGSEAPYSLFVRIYRSSQGNVEDLFLKTKLIYVKDRLNRAYKFVKWTYTVNRSRRKHYFDKNNKRKNYVMGAYRIERASVIHRTDIPGRCKFADQYSEHSSTKLFYTDALPFDVSQIHLHREEICDYCFFGGPDKDELIIDL